MRGRRATAIQQAAGRPGRRLSATDADRLLAGALLIWALFDVPWWWRPLGHAGSTPVILGTAGLAAAQSGPGPPGPGLRGSARRPS